MFGSTAAAAFDRSPGDAGAGDAELLGLSDEQRAVVLAPPGPLLVLAGAGSGKTRALTQRVARFLRAGVAPERVLLMTFTNQAARQMLARLQAQCRRVLDELWATSTGHSGGQKIGREEAYEERVK